MQASTGMVSRETCPQFGQVSSEFVIMEARRLGAVVATGAALHPRGQDDAGLRLSQRASDHESDE
jgi:hypothetical protein